METFKTSDYKNVRPDYSKSNVEKEIEVFKSLENPSIFQKSEFAMRMTLTCKHKYHTEIKDHVKYQEIKYDGWSSEDNNPRYLQYLKDYPNDEPLVCSVCGLNIELTSHIDELITWTSHCEAVEGW